MEKIQNMTSFVTVLSWMYWNEQLLGGWFYMLLKLSYNNQYAFWFLLYSMYCSRGMIPEKRMVAFLYFSILVKGKVQVTPGCGFKPHMGHLLKGWTWSFWVPSNSNHSDIKLTQNQGLATFWQQTFGLILNWLKSPLSIPAKNEVSSMLNKKDIGVWRVIVLNLLLKVSFH